MKIIVLKKNLKDGIRSVEKTTHESSHLPILKNFLIEAEDNKIKLSSTNLEIATTSFISGKIINNGAVTIPLSIFASIINNLQTERIDIEVEKNKLLIKTDNYSAEINGIKKDEFPIIPTINNKDNFIEISNLILKDALISISQSVALENKPELNGILFDYQINLFKLASTDSFRLSEKTITNNHYTSNFSKTFKIIIPIKAILEVIKELQNNENGKIKIYIDQNQILFKSENTEIISRLISGNFPEYENIIPKEFKSEISINKEEVLNAIKLAGVFTDKLNEIKISIKENSKNIEISSSNQVVGENKYLIPAKTKGEAADIMFNWKFLYDGIKNINSENLFLGLNNSNKPAYVKATEDNSWFYVIMPIKN